MEVKNKRILKNGTLAGYVKQKDGSWKWTFLKKEKQTIQTQKATPSRRIPTSLHTLP